jgi:hypothetical protein
MLFAWHCIAVTVLGYFRVQICFFIINCELSCCTRMDGERVFVVLTDE